MTLLRYGTAARFLEERGPRDERLPERDPTPPDLPSDDEWCDVCDAADVDCWCRVDEAYDLEHDA